MTDPTPEKTSEKTRWKLTIEYDGSPYVGWQRQQSDPSVQQAIEEAIEKFSGEFARLHVAGRTDAGVHALGQVAHFDLARKSDAEEIRKAINAHLRPHPIAVISAEKAAPDFHARFQATHRAYMYRIIARRPPLTVDAGRAWHVKVPLDAGAMHEAAQHLVGHHDFSTFRASQCQAESPVRTLDKLEVRTVPGHLGTGAEIQIRAEARSFLHHQIRNFAGTLKLVGEGKWTPGDVKSALEARDRTKGGPTAPPTGLYFLHVRYES